MKNKGFKNWLIHIVGYALVLITAAVLFKKNIYIDNSFFGFWGLIAVTIIYFLNKTVKPVLFILTLPITALTLGLFYPVINIFILKITDFILGNHFYIKGTISLFFVSIIISIMNTIMDKVIEKNFEVKK